MAVSRKCEIASRVVTGRPITTRQPFLRLREHAHIVALPPLLLRKYRHPSRNRHFSTILRLHRRGVSGCRVSRNDKNTVSACSGRPVTTQRAFLHVRDVP